MVVWSLVDTHGSTAESRYYVKCLAISRDGVRKPSLEKLGTNILLAHLGEAVMTDSERDELLRNILEPMLRRELLHIGVITGQADYSAKLIGWAELVNKLSMM